MVAYGFKKQFAEPILAGTKRQTIRPIGRRRHARPGEALQLYSGMRTRHCRLIACATCEAVQEIELFFNRFGASRLFRVDGAPLSLVAMDSLVKRDGFPSIEDMAAFWWAEHGEAFRHIGLIEFKGLMICWGPLLDSSAPKYPYPSPEEL